MLNIFWDWPLYIEMAEAQMANLIAQSNVALAETRCRDYVLPLSLK